MRRLHAPGNRDGDYQPLTEQDDPIQASSSQHQQPIASAAPLSVAQTGRDGLLSPGIAGLGSTAHVDDESDGDETDSEDSPFEMV
ncbi:hypothetical protein H4R34_004400, partial [Dimargaris verticillata]